MTVVIDTSVNFAAANVVTVADDYYSESDTGQLKVGDGITHWLLVPHVGDPLFAVASGTSFDSVLTGDPDIDGGVG